MRTSAKKRTQQKKRGSSVRQPMASIRSSSRPCLLDVERPASSSRRPEFSSSKAGNYSRKRTCKRRIWIKLCVKKILSCKTFSSWNKRVVFHTKNAWKLRTANKDKIRKNSESDVPAKTTAARRGSSRPAFSTSVDQPPARGDQSSSAGQPTITRGLRNELRTHKKTLNTLLSSKSSWKLVAAAAVYKFTCLILVYSSTTIEFSAKTKCTWYVG